MNGTTVYACFELNTDPAAGRQPNRPLWLLCGAVADESDAREWVEQQADDRTRRKYQAVTVGLVQSPYR